MAKWLGLNLVEFQDLRIIFMTTLMKGCMEDPFLSEDFGVLRVSPIVGVLLALFGNEENYTTFSEIKLIKFKFY